MQIYVGFQRLVLKAIYIYIKFLLIPI